MTNNKPLFNKMFVRTYASMEFIRDILAEHDSQIKAFAFIDHYKDDCEAHRHIVLWLERSMSQSTVEKWFACYRDSKGQAVNTRVETTKICRKADGTTETQTVDLQGCTYYLVHENKDGKPLPNKHHYQWDEVESKNLQLLKDYQYGKTKSAKEDKTFEILEALLCGESPYILAKRYGRDFILNYRKYTDLAFAIGNYNNEVLIRDGDVDCANKMDYLDNLTANNLIKPSSAYIIRLLDDENQLLKTKNTEKDTEIARLQSLLWANGIPNE